MGPASPPATVKGGKRKRGANDNLIGIVLGFLLVWAVHVGIMKNPHLIPPEGISYWHRHLHNEEMRANQKLHPLVPGQKSIPKTSPRSGRKGTAQKSQGVQITSDTHQISHVGAQKSTDVVTTTNQSPLHDHLQERKMKAQQQNEAPLSTGFRQRGWKGLFPGMGSPPVVNTCRTFV